MKDLPREYSYISIMPPVLDQGKSFKCVCYTLTAYLDWKVNKDEGDNISDNFDINKLYSIRARQDLNGMSIKEALHYLRHTGLNNIKIEGYAKVNSVHHLKSALILNGPCPCGLMVKDSNRSDFWNGDTVEGGHAVLIVGYNQDGFIIRNSWGTKWGDHGYALLPYDSFRQFLEVWTIY